MHLLRSSIVFASLLAFAFSFGAAAANAPMPPPPDSTPPPPEGRVVENPYAELTDEEIEAIVDQWTKQGLVEQVPARGPETAGKAIDIAGTMVQLPDDAHIGGFWMIFGKGGPFWEIIRGDSALLIHKGTGEIIAQELAPGDEDAFDFVKEALRISSLAWGLGISALFAAIGTLGIAYVRQRGDA